MENPNKMPQRKKRLLSPTVNQQEIQSVSDSSAYPPHFPTLAYLASYTTEQQARSAQTAARDDAQTRARTVIDKAATSTPSSNDEAAISHMNVVPFPKRIRPV